MKGKKKRRTRRSVRKGQDASEVVSKLTDHDRSDSSSSAVGDGLLDLRTRRILHSDESDEGHVLLEVNVVGGRLGGVVRNVRVLLVDVGESQGSKSLSSVIEEGSIELRSKGSGDGLRSSSRELNGGASVEDGFGSSLDEEES